MTEQDQLIADFVTWWTDWRNAPHIPDRFIQPPQYTHPGAFEHQDLLVWHKEGLPEQDVVEVARTVDGDTVRLEIRSTDPVTGLPYRNTFRIVTQGDRIVSVDELYEVVREGPAPKPTE